jgi:aromatic ring-opening dioxygenase catalytic subunit (LigB family)
MNLTNEQMYEGELAKLRAEIERLKAIITADTHVFLSRRPVAWRVQDHPGCWMLFQDEEKARMIGHGRLMQGLYARDGK